MLILVLVRLERKLVVTNKRLKGKRKSELRKLHKILARLTKLDIQEGDILVYTMPKGSVTTMEFFDDIVEKLREYGPARILILPEGESLESYAPALFEEAISKQVGDKATKAIMSYVTKPDAQVKPKLKTDEATVREAFSNTVKVRIDKEVDILMAMELAAGLRECDTYRSWSLR